MALSYASNSLSLSPQQVHLSLINSSETSTNEQFIVVNHILTIEITFETSLHPVRGFLFHERGRIVGERAEAKGVSFFETTSTVFDDPS
jgi:hypothetical protein